MNRVLVLGVGGGAAVNFIESLRLSDEDYFIVGTDMNEKKLGFSAADTAYVAPPCSDPGYIDFLNMLTRRHDIQLVHPQPDVEVFSLAQRRDEVDAIVDLPPTPVLERTFDKLQCNSWLKLNGIPVPWSTRMEQATPAEFYRLAEPTGQVWLRAIRGAGSKAALPVHTWEQGEMWVDYWESKAGLTTSDFMLCEFLPGVEYAWQSVWHKGRLVTSATRIRKEYFFGGIMPSGQSSTPSVAVTTHNAEVNELCRSAVEAVSGKAGPHGIFCVDAKTGADGVVKVTEINAGRFFTTSNFFALAGSNQPDTYCRLALGEEVTGLPKYNAVPEDCWWIRLLDQKPQLIINPDWES